LERAPDARTLDGECGFDGPDAVFEAKHCGTRSTDAEIFARYVPQLTHNCLCAGRSRAFLSAFKGNGDWVMFEYELDDAYAERLVAAEAAFWECVRTGKPPCAVEPEPTPKPVGVVEYDMAGAQNAWANFAGEYLETKLAADRHETARKGAEGARARGRQQVLRPRDHHQERQAGRAALRRKGEE
jgi:hypothetical protein